MNIVTRVLVLGTAMGVLFISNSLSVRAQTTTVSCEYEFNSSDRIFVPPIYYYLTWTPAVCSAPLVIEPHAYVVYPFVVQTPSTWTFRIPCGSIDEPVTNPYGFMYLYKDLFRPWASCSPPPAAPTYNNCSGSMKGLWFDYTFSEPGLYQLVLFLPVDEFDEGSLEFSVEFPDSEYPGFPQCNPNYGPDDDITVWPIKEIDGNVTYAHGQITSDENPIFSHRHSAAVRVEEGETNFIEAGHILYKTMMGLEVGELPRGSTMDRRCNVYDLGAQTQDLCSYYRFDYVQLDSQEMPIAEGSEEYVTPTHIRPDGLNDRRGQTLWYRIWERDENLDIWRVDVGGYGQWGLLGEFVHPSNFTHVGSGVAGDYSNTVFRPRPHSFNAYSTISFNEEPNYSSGSHPFGRWWIDYCWATVRLSELISALQIPTSITSCAYTNDSNHTTQGTTWTISVNHPE